MPEVAIIGGTGVYDPGLLTDTREYVQGTEYGDVKVLVGKHNGIEVAFIPRHGSKHSVPPHLINFRANIMALYKIGVRSILGTAAVGSLNYDYKPGEVVLADQFLDFTKQRISTFFEGGEQGVIHCDMTVPYCPELRKVLQHSADEKGINIHNGGVYVCTEGPRFETSAEIAMFKQLGGDIVGMTSVPEVCLARELGICYANVSIVTNFAAGISPKLLTHNEVVEVMGKSLSKLRSLLMDSIKGILLPRKCNCSSIAETSGVLK
ncbi:MAG: S-methyl-5'-thioadenosine phosphorylase [Syntrophomonadaceae bacterium]|jgi:5'-methylthioadenosine phosphorylase